MIQITLEYNELVEIARDLAAWKDRAEKAEAELERLKKGDGIIITNPFIEVR